MTGVPATTVAWLKSMRESTSATPTAGAASACRRSAARLVNSLTRKAPTPKVTAPAATLTLQAGATTVVYGNSTTVAGAVTNQLTNEPVNLTSQPFGKGTQSIATQTTQANGAFSFDVSPTIQTSYVAHWRTSASPSVSVNVAPRVGFGQSGRLYVAKVTSDLGYAGHYVWVQRKSPYGSFRNVKRIYLSAASRATFRVHIPKGRSILRLVLPADQAGSGYVGSLSRLIAVKR